MFAIDDLHVNGELTLGENIGDFSGLTMSFYGLQKALAENPVDEIDGFTAGTAVLSGLGPGVAGATTDPRRSSYR